MKYLLPLASPASPLCPCNDPLLHPALIYAAFCVAISTTVHSNLSPTRAHSSYFPGLRAKLFNFFIRRETRETSCHGSFAGNGNCNGAGVLWSRRKKVCVWSVPTIVRSSPLRYFLRAEICGRIFSSFSFFSFFTNN